MPVRRRIPTRAGLLGWIASGELLVRGLGDGVLVRTADGALVPAAASIAVHAVTTFPTFQVVANWLLVVAVLYLFGPAVFRRVLPDHVDRLGFRLVVAGTAFLSFLPVQYHSAASGPHVQGALAPLSWLLVDRYFLYLPAAVLSSMLLFLVYFWVTANRPFFDSGSSVMQLFVSLVGRYEEDPVAYLRRRHDAYANRGGVTWFLVAGFTAIAIGVIHTLPVVLLGVVAGVVNAVFPLLELLVLGWAVNRVASERFRHRFDRTLPFDRLLSVEEDFYKGVRLATHSTKGWAAVTLVCAALIATASAYSFAFSLVDVVGFGNYLDSVFVWDELWFEFTHDPHRWREDTLYQIGTVVAISLSGWNWIGLGVAVSTLGLYGMWFWYRELKRLPHFLSAWAVSVEAEAVPELTESQSTPVVRPPGLMLPPTLLFAAGIGHFSHVVLGDAGFGTDSTVLVWLVGPGFALVWPILTVATAWTVWRGIHGNPQPHGTDAYAIPGTVLCQGTIQWFVLWQLGVISRNYAVGGIGMFVVFLPWYFFLDDVQHYANRSDGPSRFLDSVYFALGGTILVGISLCLTGSYSNVFRYGGVATVTFAFLLVAVTIYDSRRFPH